MQSIDFQNILRDEFQKFLSINMLSPPPSSNLLPTHSALQHSSPVAGNISHEAFQINQGAAAVPQASSSFPPAPVIAAANHLSLPESLFNNLMQPSPTTVLSPTSTSRSLPPLPRNILDQIQAGKFVKSDDLLPAVSPLNTDEYSIKINSASGGDPSISLVPNRQNRPRVVDFHTWLTAWNSYLQAMAFYHPTQVTDLIHYQSVFTRFASQYTFSACFAYDRLFRHAMANNPTLSWARVDDDLFTRYLRGAPLRTICFSCHNYGHMSTNCPLRNPVRQPTAATSINHTDLVATSPHNLQVSNQPFRAPQTAIHRSRQTCRYFNYGQCTFSGCQYAHQCRNCFGNHPQSRCTARRGGFNQ